MTTGTARPTGSLAYHVERCKKAPISWRLRNTLTIRFIRGWIAYHVAPILAKVIGFGTITSQLSFKVCRADGSWEDYGVVSYRQVTTVGITAMALSFGTQASPGNFFYHALGTGAGAEAAANTALSTELTTEYTGDVRATGTHTEAAGVYTTVATNTLDSGTPTVTEHGIFTANAAGSLLDKHLFTGIAMASGDSFVSTYNLTFTAGG